MVRFGPVCDSRLGGGKCAVIGTGDAHRVASPHATAISLRTAVTTLLAGYRERLTEDGKESRAGVTPASGVK